MASCLNRIEEVNPKVNALVEVSVKEAFAAADAADNVVSKGEQLGPLHGVPIATKVNSDQAGHATTNGVTAFRDNIALVDGPEIANLRKAGAVFLGRSNTPAFSHRWFTNNNLHGKTLNPWDSSRTPGGSSGGAAVATATGMVPIAQGNDIGGSIRYPAYACGVTGIRPTPGRVPSWTGPANKDKSLSMQFMSVQGPLARSVSDLRLALTCMSEFDPRSPIYTAAPFIGEPLARPIRVGLLRGADIVKPDPAINQALDTAAAWLTDAGYIVEEIELSIFAEAFKLWWLLCMEEFRPMLPYIEQVADAEMIQSVKHTFVVAEELWGPKPNLSDYIDGYSRRGTLISQLQQFLSAVPLLLLPVSAEQAFEQDADFVSFERARNLVFAQWPMMAIALLGFPAISIPTSVIDGLPVGVQLLGRRFREDTLFTAAEVIEARNNVSTPINPW